MAGNEHALTLKHFGGTLAALSGALPFAKPIPTETFLLLWGGFPSQAKQEVTPEMWTYAATQRCMDPSPDKESPLPFQLLRYLYRLENGTPNVEWGLKPDLVARMAHSGIFHDQPRSTADLIAAEGVPNLDGKRHEPAGVLAQLGWQP
jgi:hypothetical protein